jgi:hypothetical protein
VSPHFASAELDDFFITHMWTWTQAVLDFEGIEALDLILREQRIKKIDM